MYYIPGYKNSVTGKRVIAKGKLYEKCNEFRLHIRKDVVISKKGTKAVLIITKAFILGFRNILESKQMNEGNFYISYILKIRYIIYKIFESLQLLRNLRKRKCSGWWSTQVHGIQRRNTGKILPCQELRLYFCVTCPATPTLPSTKFQDNLELMTWY